MWTTLVSSSMISPMGVGMGVATPRLRGSFLAALNPFTVGFERSTTQHAWSLWSGHCPATGSMKSVRPSPS